jgi:hypothetical protein
VRAAAFASASVTASVPGSAFVGVTASDATPAVTASDATPGVTTLVGSLTMAEVSGLGTPIARGAGVDATG